MDDLALRISMRIDNVQLQSGSPSLVQNSYFGIDMPPPEAPVNTPFDVVPYNDGGRFTFLFDDMNANAGSATIEPDGGGYMLKFYFETSGTEVRSICEPRLFHPDFGFESEEGKSAEDILAFLANGWKKLSCALGGEYTAELGFITAEVRVFLEAVDVPGGDNDIRFRPVSPVNPTRDIFVDFDVLTQSGPCEGNLMAIQDDCREKDELEV